MTFLPSRSNTPRSPPPQSSTSSSSLPSQIASSSSSRQQYSQHPAPDLPLPPTTDRNDHSHVAHQKFRLMRKGRDTGRQRGTREEDEDWQLEGAAVKSDERERLGLVRTSNSNLQPLIDSQMKELPPKEEAKKRLKGRVIAKKTSKLFSRNGEKERSDEGIYSGGAAEPDSSSSLSMPSGSRQPSYSSVASSETNGSIGRNHFYRPFSRKSVNKSPQSSHSRRLSQESQGSWQAASRSIRSGSKSTHTSPTEGHQLLVPQGQTRHLGASVSSLSQQALPQPAAYTDGAAFAGGVRTGDTFPSRMSTWFSHLIPSSSTSTVVESSISSASVEIPNTNPTSPSRRPPSAAASFLNAARQRAVDGVRHLIDSEAQPDKCPETIWVMGVPHPGWRPSAPEISPDQQNAALLVAGDDGPRQAESPGMVSSRSKPEAGMLRPGGWSKRKEASTSASPPSKGFTNLFSTSSLSLALPAAIASGSPGKETDGAAGGADSPGKAKRRKSKEVLRWPDEFYDDFRSRVWCTYRSQYAPISALPHGALIPHGDAYYSAFDQPGDLISLSPTANSLAATSLPSRAPPTAWSWSRSTDLRGLTSDAGWGCMLRTGQSMLANALTHLHLGRDWRVPREKPVLEPKNATEAADLHSYATYVRILSWFLDDPSPLCPFSVHRMALIGKELGKEVGEWFGPSTAAGALKTLANSFPPGRLAVATATDSMVYKSSVYAASNLVADGWLADEEYNGNNRRPSITQPKSWGSKAVLILIGIRLGLDGVNPIYHNSVKMLFTFPQSVGIAGGRPSSSYYFVASQASSLFYLDPHLTRPAIPLEIPPTPILSKNDAIDTDEAVLVDPPDAEARDSPVHVPYTLDVIDVDDASDDSDRSYSPSDWLRSPRASAHAAQTHEAGAPLPLIDRQPSSSGARDTPVGFFNSGSHQSSTSADGSSTRQPRPVDPQTLWYASAYSEAQLRTLHCEKVKKMPLSGLDPSMLLGFLCRDEADFEDFCERVGKLPQKIFTVQDEPPTWDDNDAAGLESVSEPDGDDRDFHGQNTSLANDEANEKNFTLEAIPIPVDGHSLTETSRGKANWDPAGEGQPTPISQPRLVKRPSNATAMDRPSMASRTRTESWVQTGLEE